MSMFCRNEGKMTNAGQILADGKQILPNSDSFHQCPYMLYYLVDDTYILHFLNTFQLWHIVRYIFSILSIWHYLQHMLLQFHTSINIF